MAIKSGNAVILKGGSEARHSNQELARLIRETLGQFDFMPEGTMSLLNTREEVSRILQASDCIDLIVPRGSNALVRYIQTHSKAPVLAHADGVCHVYLDREADVEKSEEIALDAKLQYPAVCNAMETLLVHHAYPRYSFVEILKKLQDAGVELRVCRKTREQLAGIDSLRLAHACDKDWGTEYTDLILSLKNGVFPAGSGESHQRLWLQTYGCDRHRKQRQGGMVHEPGGRGQRFLERFHLDFPTDFATVSAPKWESAPVRLTPGVPWDWKVW